MIKNLLLMVFLIPSIGVAQFSIKGNIVDSENTEDLEIFLSISTDNGEKRVPAIIKGGSFSVHSSINEPINSMLTIVNDGKRKSAKILLDNKSTYEVDIVLRDIDQFFNSDWYKIVTESEYHNVWDQFYDKQGELYAKKKDVLAKYENQEISKDELDHKVLQLDYEMNQEFKDLATNNPNNYAVPYILNGAPDFSDIYFKYYNKLSEDVKRSYWGKKLKERLNNLDGNPSQSLTTAPVLGTKFVSLTGEDLTGNTKIFNKENLKSKLTLIDFWASWCGPCRKENIEIGILNTSYENQDFRVISFSLDQKKSAWKAASNKDNITWENISDLEGANSRVMKEFQINQLPRNILVDSEGTIIAVNKFGANLKDFVKKYLQSF